LNLLVNALQRMSATFDSEAAIVEPTVLIPEIPRLAMTPRDAFYATTEVVPITKAVGRISAEFIMVYPPGIPIFIPGEIITQENIDYIRMNVEAGLPVQGPEDDTLQMLRVIKEQQAIR
jgi:lysine decarboxylase